MPQGGIEGVAAEQWWTCLLTRAVICVRGTSSRARCKWGVEVGYRSRRGEIFLSWVLWELYCYSFPVDDLSSWDPEGSLETKVMELISKSHLLPCTASAYTLVLTLCSLVVSSKAAMFPLWDGSVGQLPLVRGVYDIYVSYAPKAQDWGLLFPTSRGIRAASEGAIREYWRGTGGASRS